MNTVLNCGQELSSSQEQFFRFLYCIESQAGPGVQAQIPGLLLPPPPHQEQVLLAVEVS